MNRQFLAGVLAIIVATVCITVPECSGWAPPLVIESDWELYTPVGTTVEIHAWVVEGGPVDTWVWSWGSGVMEGEPNSSGDSSTSRGHFSSPGRYSVWVSAYGEGGSDDARTYVWNVDVVIDTPSSFPAYVALGQSLALGCTPLGATGGSFAWSKASGPGNVTFTPTIAAEDPSFSADQAGDYTVQVLYSKGATVSDTSGTIKVVEVNDVISSAEYACVGQNVTFGAITYPLNCAPYVTITWSAPGGTPSSGNGSQFTTKWSTPGPQTVTATCGSSNASKQVTIVAVDKLQYNDPDTGYTDVSGTMYVHKGTSVTFKAIPDPCNASWPSGKPVWGGEASGVGSTTLVTFDTLSSSTSDYKIVSAECGDIIQVSVIVYDFEGTLTPDDNFDPNRSYDEYGIEEIVHLDFTTTPSSITASQAGGLVWSKYSGWGTVSNAGSDGTATYDAEEYPSYVYLYLEITSGPSKGAHSMYTKYILMPSGAYMIQAPGTGIWHAYGYASVGFTGWIYLEPTNVSFSNLNWREGSCYGTGTGYLSFKTGEYHPVGNEHNVLGGNYSTGCQVDCIDTVATGQYPSPFGSGGTFTWPIPWQYKDDTGNWHEFTTATHYETVDSSGTATIQKGGAGPFPHAYP